MEGSRSGNIVHGILPTLKSVAPPSFPPEILLLMLILNSLKISTVGKILFPLFHLLHLYGPKPSLSTVFHRQKLYKNTQLVSKLKGKIPLSYPVLKTEATSSKGRKTMVSDD
jgi:hypothetical protein